MLEAIIALVIAGVAILAIMNLIVEIDESANKTALAEREFEKADNFFQHVALWTRHELEQRVGNHEQGTWRLQIDRVDEQLFNVALYQSRTSTTPILFTVLYRPGEQSGSASVNRER